MQSTKSVIETKEKIPNCLVEKAGIIPMLYTRDRPAKVLSTVGDRGIMVYPGQSGERVLELSKLIEHLTDLAPYSARNLASEVLLFVAKADA